MNQHKSHRFRPPLYHASGAASRTEANGKGAQSDDDHERRGWEAYRKWLSTMSTKPAAERTPADHSIYSWKGYQNWADKVRQSWKPEKG